MPCRLCGKVTKQVVVPGHAQVFNCGHCGALHGTCYLGDSYALVKPQMTASDPKMEHSRYFDLTTLGSTGVGRRHGWYCPATRLVTQAG